MTITPSLVANRITAVAPAVIHFDATGTTDTEAGSMGPFHEIIYVFDFGDPASGAWAFSGKSKNKKIGAGIAAHCYETPGTYTVNMLCIKNSETIAATPLTITIEDPGIVYSGTDTICVSLAGEFTGAPAGSTQVTAIPSEFLTAYPSGHVSQDYTDKRLLLKRGDDYSGNTIRTRFGMHDIQIGDWGDAADPLPKVDGVWFEKNNGAGNTIAGGFPSNCSVYNIDCGQLMDAGGSTTNILFLRCKANVTDDGATLESTACASSGGMSFWAMNPVNGTVASDFPAAQNHAFVECFIGGRTTHDGFQISAYAEGALGSFLGCNFAEANSHHMRLPQFYKYVVEHSFFAGNTDPNLPRLCIKAHSDGNIPFNGTDQHEEVDSRYLDINNNIFGTSAGYTSYHIAPSPTNAFIVDNEPAEYVRDVIMADNVHIDGPFTARSHSLFGSHMTIRGAQFDSGLPNPHIFATTDENMAANEPSTDYLGLLPLGNYDTNNSPSIKPNPVYVS